jgi:hypothetical protein
MGEPMFSREVHAELGHVAPQAEIARRTTQEDTP